MRLTPEQRRQLDKWANSAGIACASYARAKLFTGHPIRATRAPSIERQAQQKAYESHEKFISQPGQDEKQQPDFETYVQHVQTKNAERMERLKKKAASLDFADGGLQPFERVPPPLRPASSSAEGRPINSTPGCCS